MGGLFNDVNPSREVSTILPTIIRIGGDELDYWTSMTCFYDKNWNFDPSFSTVPLAFMHVTSCVESITASCPEKRVILYEAPEQSATSKGFNPVVTQDGSYRNNIEVIMDNVVVQPKQFQLEVIIPDSLIGPYHKQGLARLDALAQYLRRTTSDDNSLAKKVSTGIQVAQVFLETVETAFNAFSSILGLASGVGSSQIATMNKNSLEVMAAKGRVVLFKKWAGYNFSYGVITKVDFSKKPSEEGVFRGSITFQEVPILNISYQKTELSSVGGWRGLVSTVQSGAVRAARIVNLGLAYPFLKLTGVMDKAGVPGSKTAEGGSFKDSMF